MRQNRPKGRRAMMIEVTGTAAVNIVRRWPKDTGRSNRAWAEAARKAGIASPPMTTLKKSRDSDAIQVRLEYQVSKWEGIVRNYGDRRDKHYRKAVRIRDRARETLANFLAAEDPAILIGGRKVTKRFGVSNLASVRTTVFGGTGRIIEHQGETIVEMHNKEPHASIVERRTKVVGTELRKMRREQNIRRASKKYLREVDAKARAA